jgi:hypothetical protein
MSKLPGDFGDSEKKFDPAEMQRRVDQMKAEGKMPSLESFLQVMKMVREEWQRGTFHAAEGLPAPEAMMSPTGTHKTSPRKSPPAVRRPN